MGIISKTDKDFFDMLYASEVKGYHDNRENIRVALQAFLQKPQKAMRKKLQASGVSTDLARLERDAFNVTIADDNFDMGYEQAFLSLPIGDGQDSWEIYNVTNGITFEKVPEGGRIRVNEMSGSKATAYIDWYGGAIGWTIQMIEGRKIASMLNIAMRFRNQFWANKAANHYLLIAAAVTAGGNTTAYQGVADDGQLQRDIQTINQAIFTLTDRCKDKGFGNTASIPLIMFANPLDRNRILAALNVTTASLAAAGRTGQTINQPVTPIFTFDSNITSGSPVLMIPGNDAQRVDKWQPRTFIAPQDVLTLQSTQAVWAAYGAAIGDTDQVQGVTLG